MLITSIKLEQQIINIVRKRHKSLPKKDVRKVIKPIDIEPKQI